MKWLATLLVLLLLAACMPEGSYRVRRYDSCKPGYTKVKYSSRPATWICEVTK